MRGKHIVFTAPNTAELQGFEFDESLAEDEVLVETIATLISTGTELANFTGLSPNVWIKGAWGAYPHVPGYTAVGRVLAVGDGVGRYGRQGQRIVPGVRVFGFTPHASVAKASVSRRLLFPLDDGDDVNRMLLARMGMVASAGMRALHRPAYGRDVVVIGQGLVGLFAAQLLDIAGAEVVAYDRAPRRVELARSLGVDARLGPAEGEELGEIADIVIEAIGNPRLVPAAVAMARNLGEVVLLGSPRGPGDDAGPVLSDIHHRGISLTGALEWLVPFHAASAGTGPSLEDAAHMVMRWIRSGRLRTEGMISDVRSPVDCQDAFARLSEDRNAYHGVVFDWRGIA
ncbi:MAG TPA: zinc-binding dehydrogenase [Candidatus Dormibacteraeota bacterium]|jgi:2-desacetyl-2-hydroxyethyl bacteriochlorophyllide A dehydrogenase|nr:zinc-binding dehydrogenase [Candidatus Dormibacteraeota bacterium]